MNLPAETPYTDTAPAPTPDATAPGPDKAGPPMSVADALRRVRARQVILAVGALTVIVGGWAATSEFDYTVDGAGAIAPAGQIRPIQHAQGGVVSQILSQEGALVAKGDLLVSLDAAQVDRLLDQARSDEAWLRLKVERLQAVSEGREPNFGSAAPEFQNLVKDQWAIYNGHIRLQENNRALLDSKIEQLQTDLKRLDAEDATLAQKAQILAEELAMREALYRKGLSPKVIMLNTQRQVADVRGEIAALIAKREKVDKEIEETNTELKSVDETAKATALDELNNARLEVAQAEEKRKQLERRRASLDLRAPVRGHVSGIYDLKPGGIAKPGEVLFEIVPVDERLIAEVSIPAKFAGRLRAGQAATILVDGSNEQVRGELRQISSKQQSDRTGAGRFRAVVALDKAFSGNNPNENRLIPGMPVKVKVLVERRKLLEHLFSPETPPKSLF